MRLRRSGAAPDGPAEGAAAGGAAEDGAAPARRKRPLYVRLLHLQHVQPSAWQRAALGEGALAVAVVLVLADLASAWTLLVLPLGVALVVKAHDLLAGLLGGEPRPRAGETAGDRSVWSRLRRSGDDDGAGPLRGPAPSDARGED